MVSLINFGNISTVNGRTVMNGSQSGLDTTSLIEQLAKAKRLPAIKFEDTIKVNNNRITALTEMKTLLNNLKTAVSKLRSPVGFSSASSNAFEARSSYVSMSNGETASNYIGVTTSNGAPIGKYNLSITNLAVAQSDLSESFSSLGASVVAGDGTGGPGTGKFNAGTFNIGYNDANGNPQSSQVTLAAGANLATVRDAINAKAATTGVKATIIKFSETDYRLKLYSDKTGTANAYSFTGDSGTAVNFTTTAADNSRIELDGETIVRSGNVIDDLIDNVTLTLYQKTNTSNITLEVDKNGQGVAEGIAEFLGSYNQLRMFAAQQTEVDEDGQLKDTAYLKNNAVMQTVMNKLSAIVSGSNGAGLLSPEQLSLYSTGSAISTPKSLADLGIYFSDQAAISDGENSSPAVENLLSLDISKLSNHLQKYFDQTRSLFEFNFASDNAQLNSYSRSNKIYENNIGSFTINIDLTSGNANVSGLKDSAGNPLNPSTVPLDYSLSNGTVTLKGKAGTMLEGMDFFYTGAVTGTATANITVSQGVGDVMFNQLDSYLANLNGQLSVIDKEIESLRSQNEDAQDSVERIDTMVTSYRDLMLNKFSALEALISASNQVLLLLDAQSSAANK